MSSTALRACAALVAIVALGAAVGTAHARNLSIRGAERGFRFTWPAFRAVIFTGVTIKTGYLTDCPVTLEGSFHTATVAKINRWLLGYVSSANVAEASCRGVIGPEEFNGGQPFPVKLRVLRETLPWHLQYLSFAGTLPGIASIRVQFVGAAFQVYELVSGGWCLYRSEAATPMPYTLTLGAGREVTTVRPDASPTPLPLFAAGALCESGGMAYSGDATVSSPSGIAISITLI
jgi:hypothetical protein